MAMLHIPCSLCRYHATESMSASRRMLKLAGVVVRQHQPKARRVTIDFDEVDR